MSQKRVRAVQEILCQLDVFKLIIFYFANPSFTEQEYLCLRKRQNDRRVSRDNELRILLHHLLERGEKAQLPHRRKRGFRLIQEIQAIGYKTRLEKGQE